MADRRPAAPATVRVVTAPPEHWEEIYSTRSSTEVSWFQREPSVSLRLIAQYAAIDRSIIDIGSGTSFLADRLLALGYDDITLLDISSTALSEVSARVGGDAPKLHVIAGDVLEWTPARSYDLWHDRAVFHFLRPGEPRSTYVQIAARALRPGATLVLAVFALDGPSHCSGLEVQRYGVEDLVDLFGGYFSLEHHEGEIHVTPSEASQSFNWTVFRRNEN